MDSLYIAERPGLKFAEAIASKRQILRQGEFYTASDLETAKAHIDYVGLVVLVGKQRRVFGNVSHYFDFIDYAHEKGKKIKAVIEEGDSLPNGNDGIDSVIYSIWRKTTVTKIAREL